MSKFAVGTKKRIVDVDLRPSCSIPGYSLGYLSSTDKRSIGLSIHTDAAVRVDGSRAELVKVINGYTARMMSAIAL